jgi:hypothetical protein
VYITYIALHEQQRGQREDPIGSSLRRWGDKGKTQLGLFSAAERPNSIRGDKGRTLRLYRKDAAVGVLTVLYQGGLASCCAPLLDFFERTVVAPVAAVASCCAPFIYL